MTSALTPRSRSRAEERRAAGTPRRHALSRARRRTAVAVRRARLRAARHGGALRGEGQPAPRAAHRAGGGRVPLRRGQSGGGAGGPRRRRQPRIARLLQPGQAPRPRRRGGTARGAPVRGRLARRGREGRPGGARAARCCAGSPPPARGRTGRSRASTAAPPTRPSSCSPRPTLGLDAAGLSFHVGSQQRDPEAWAAPDRRRRPGLRRCCAARSGPAAARPGRRLPGGVRRRLPAALGVRRGRSSATFAARSATTVRRRSSNPGAAWSATPATLVSTVIGVRPPRTGCAGCSWTPGSSPAWWRPWTRRSATGCGPRPTAARPDPACWPARPATARTCSTSDRMVDLPLDLAEGDEVRLLSAGAYTTCYSTVGFNGFAPLATLTGP